MVKKSVLLTSSLVVGLILGSGANAVRTKPGVVEEGQRRLYECRGLPLKAKARLHTAALKQMNKENQAEALRRLQKAKAQDSHNYFLKVDITPK